MPAHHIVELKINPDFSTHVVALQTGCFRWADELEYRSDGPELEEGGWLWNLHKGIEQVDVPERDPRIISALNECVHDHQFNAIRKGLK